MYFYASFLCFLAAASEMSFCSLQGGSKIPHKTNMQFIDNRVKFFIAEFTHLYGRDTATILRFLTNYFSFFQT